MDTYKDKDILQANRLAISNLKSQESLVHLKHAEDLLINSAVQHPSKLWAITFQNFACYYKHAGELALALHYYTKSAQVDNHPVRTAGTLLELAYVYGKEQKQTQALRSVKRALQLLDSSRGYSHKKIYQVTLALGFHCLGRQLEALGQRQEALEAYKQGLHKAIASIPSHRVIDSLQQSIDRLSSQRLFTPPQRTKLPSRLVKSRSHTRKTVRSENRASYRRLNNDSRNQLGKPIREKATRALSELQICRS